jgi:hypothetical protein
MIQPEKIHFETSNGIVGLTAPFHLLKKSRLNAV